MISPYTTNSRLANCLRECQKLVVVDLNTRPSILLSLDAVVQIAGLAPLLLLVRLETLLPVASVDETLTYTGCCFISQPSNFAPAFHSRISDAEQHES